MIAAAIILTIYKTSAAMLSAKRPQSMHRILDATIIFLLNHMRCYSQFFFILGKQLSDHQYRILFHIQSRTIMRSPHA